MPSQRLPAAEPLLPAQPGPLGWDDGARMGGSPLRPIMDLPVPRTFPLLALVRWEGLVPRPTATLQTRQVLGHQTWFRPLPA